jgi:hypothetical protein
MSWLGPGMDFGKTPTSMALTCLRLSKDVQSRSGNLGSKSFFAACVCPKRIQNCKTLALQKQGIKTAFVALKSTSLTLHVYLFIFS